LLHLSEGEGIRKGDHSKHTLAGDLADVFGRFFFLLLAFSFLGFWMFFGADSASESRSSHPFFFHACFWRYQWCSWLARKSQLDFSSRLDAKGSPNTIS
jgi:hypothetical protein